MTSENIWQMSKSISIIKKAHSLSIRGVANKSNGYMPVYWGMTTTTTTTTSKYVRTDC